MKSTIQDILCKHVTTDCMTYWKSIQIRSNFHNNISSCNKKSNRYNKRASAVGAGGSRMQESAGSLAGSGIKGEVVFGIHPVHLALQCRRRTQLHALYVKTGGGERLRGIMSLADMLHVPVVDDCSGRMLDALVRHSGPHQGVCLDASPINYRDIGDIDELISEHHSASPQLWLGLDQVKDPMNMGSIIRTAHYLGVSGIISPERHSSALNGVVSKASSGVLECWPHIYSTPHLHTTIQELGARQFHILGTAAAREGGGSAPGRPPVVTIHNLLTHHSRPLQLRNTLLLIGNEGSGVSAELLSLCAHLITISPDPRRRQQQRQQRQQPGLLEAVDSLNVSAATAILIHTIRQCQAQRSG